MLRIGGSNGSSVTVPIPDLVPLAVVGEGAVRLARQGRLCYLPRDARMFVVPPILADIGGVVVVTDRTEADVRSPGTTVGKASFDLTNRPTLFASLAEHRWSLTLAYNATITAADVDVPPLRPAVFQTVGAHVTWQARRFAFFAGEDVGYGKAVFLGPASPAPPLATATTPAPAGATTGENPNTTGNGTPSQTGGSTTTGAGPTAPNSTLTNALPQSILTTTTVLGTTGRMGLWTLGVNLAYLESGGTTDESAQALPRQYGPRGDASLGYSVSRADQLYTSAYAQRVDSNTQTASVIISDTLGWRRNWSRAVSSDLGGGISSSQTRPVPAARVTRSLLPTANAALNYASMLRGTQLTLRLFAVLTQTIDRVTSTADNRVDGGLVGNIAKKRVSAHVLFGTGQSIDRYGPNAVNLIFGEVGASWTPVPAMTLDVGLRIGHQEQRTTFVAADGTAASSVVNRFSQTAGFIGVTFRTPSTRF